MGSYLLNMCPYKEKSVYAITYHTIFVSPGVLDVTDCSYVYQVLRNLTTLIRRPDNDICHLYVHVCKKYLNSIKLKLIFQIYFFRSLFVFFGLSGQNIA